MATVDGVATEFEASPTAAAAGRTETESAVGELCAAWPTESLEAPEAEAAVLTAVGLESTRVRFRDLCRFESASEESDELDCAPAESDPAESDPVGEDDPAASAPGAPVEPASADAEPFV